VIRTATWFDACSATLLAAAAMAHKRFEEDALRGNQAAWATLLADDGWRQARWHGGKAQPAEVWRLRQPSPRIDWRELSNCRSALARRDGASTSLKHAHPHARGMANRWPYKSAKLSTYLSGSHMVQRFNIHWLGHRSARLRLSESSASSSRMMARRATFML
jgi:hypothetical protein